MEWGRFVRDRRGAPRVGSGVEEVARRLDAGEVNTFASSGRPTTSTALKVSRNRSSASPADLIWIVSVLATIVPRDSPHVGHEICQKLINVREIVRCLDSLDVPVVPFRRVVVVEHHRIVLARPHEREPISQPLRLRGVVGTRQITNSRMLPSSSTTLSREEPPARRAFSVNIWYVTPHINRCAQIHRSGRPRQRCVG